MFRKQMNRVASLSELERGVIRFPAKITPATARRLLAELDAVKAAITRALKKR